MTDNEDATSPNTPPRDKRSKNNTNNTNDSPGGIQTVDSEATTVTLRHTVSGQHSRGAASATILGMSKPVAAIVSVLLLGSVGAGLFGWISNPFLTQQIKDLEAQVDRLNGQVDRLEAQVTRLEDQVDRLETSNELLETLNQHLNRTVDELQDVSSSLNQTVWELQGLNQNLTLENDRLGRLNNELQSILLFLNETATNFDILYDDLVDTLAEQITANRVLVLQTLQNTYLQQVNAWDCAFRDIFRGESFVVEEDSAIGDSHLDSVLQYVEERVLSELCLDRNDFESFVIRRYTTSNITTNELYQAVALYTNAALDYFFPDPGEEGGLTDQDWARAGYECDMVPAFLFNVE